MESGAITWILPLQVSITKGGASINTDAKLSKAFNALRVNRYSQ